MGLLPKEDRYNHTLNVDFGLYQSTFIKNFL